MKKYFCLLMSVILCVLAVSCTNTGNNETTTQMTTQNTTSSTSVTTETTTTTATETSTTDVPVIPPVVTESLSDTLSLKVGKYTTVLYNPDYCEIETSVKAGVGSKETVTLKVTMKDGYIFDGWSIGNAISNNVKTAETSTEYSFDASIDKTIYVNYSLSVVYYPNGGKVSDGNNTYTQNFSIVMYKCPATLPEQGYFVRDGYTLVEYNTKADGTGEAVSLGSKISTGGKSSLELYCIWEKQNDASDFEYKDASNDRVKITKYIGSSDNVVIPDKIDGKTVYSIGDGAFESAKVKRVVFSKNIVAVETNAFSYCDVESLVFFDSLMSVSDDCFEGNILKNIRINSALNLYADGMSYVGGVKLDRLIWAKNMKKIVIFGGSGTHNGWDCGAIEDAFDDEYVVINLGSNANIMASLYFEFLNEYMNDDDILLWSPEIGEAMLGLTNYSRASRMWEYLSPNYDILRYSDVSNYKGIFASYQRFAQQHMNKQASFERFDKNTDFYGDNVAIREHQTRTNAYASSFERLIPQMKSITTYLSAQIKSLTEKGIKVYYTPALMDESGSGINEKFPEFLEEFIQAFPDLTVISKLETCLVPSDYMSDSEWHATLAGAEMRTKAVINDLKAQLEKEG